MFRDVKDIQWSIDHIARHDVTREEDLPAEGALMTMKKITEKLPRPADELVELAAHYDTQDTAEEMDRGEWVDPRPMRTTSLRLPAEVVEALKALAQARGVRYTALVREMLEQALREATQPDSQELSEINARLTRIEQAVVGREPRQKRAMRSVASTRQTGRVHRQLASKGKRKAPR